MIDRGRRALVRHAVAIAGLASISAPVLSAYQIAIDPPLIGPCLSLNIRREWRPPTLLFKGVNVQQPSVAVAPSGHAMAVWIDIDAPGNRTVYYSRYTVPSLLRPGAGWSAPTLLGQAGSNATRVRVAMDDDGNALMAWAGATGPVGEAIITNNYDAASGSSQPVAIPPGGHFRRATCDRTFCRARCRRVGGSSASICICLTPGQCSGRLDATRKDQLGMGMFMLRHVWRSTGPIGLWSFGSKPLSAHIGSSCTVPNMIRSLDGVPPMNWIACRDTIQRSLQMLR